MTVQCFKEVEQRFGCSFYQASDKALPFSFYILNDFIGACRFGMWTPNMREKTHVNKINKHQMVKLGSGNGQAKVRLESRLFSESKLKSFPNQLDSLG